MQITLQQDSASARLSVSKPHPHPKASSFAVPLTGEPTTESHQTLEGNLENERQRPKQRGKESDELGRKKTLQGGETNLKIITINILRKIGKDTLNPK